MGRRWVFNRFENRISARILSHLVVVLVVGLLSSRGLRISSEAAAAAGRGGKRGFCAKFYSATCRQRSFVVSLLLASLAKPTPAIKQNALKLELYTLYIGCLPREEEIL